MKIFGVLSILIIKVLYAEHFFFNKSVPTLSLAKELLELCPQIEEGYTSIIIEGHTDKRGSQLYNLKLGKKRAETTKIYLADLCGLDLNKIRTVSMGETEATGVHKHDRKVVIHIIQQNQKTVVIREQKEKPISQQSTNNTFKRVDSNYFVGFNISNPYTNLQTRQGSNWAEIAIERGWAVGVQGYKRLDNNYYFGIGLDTARTLSIGVGFSF